MSHTHTTHTKTHQRGWTPHRKSVHLLLQTIRALRRGAPCLVRKVNCAFNRTGCRKPLMGTSAREDVAGGSTAIAAAWLMTSRRFLSCFSLSLFLVTGHFFSRAVRFLCSWGCFDSFLRHARAPGRHHRIAAIISYVARAGRTAVVGKLEV